MGLFIFDSHSTASLFPSEVNFIIVHISLRHQHLSRKEVLQHVFTADLNACLLADGPLLDDDLLEVVSLLRDNLRVDVVDGDELPDFVVHHRQLSADNCVDQVPWELVVHNEFRKFLADGWFNCCV